MIFAIKTRNHELVNDVVNVLCRTYGSVKRREDAAGVLADTVASEAAGGGRASFKQREDAVGVLADTVASEAAEGGRASAKFWTYLLISKPLKNSTYPLISKPQVGFPGGPKCA